MYVTFVIILFVFFFFFFFQAEDGIRDLTVTGVQTCALPISTSAPARTASRGCSSCATTCTTTAASPLPRPDCPTRSEERRVGKSVDLGGRRIIKKKKKNNKKKLEEE